MKGGGKKRLWKCIAVKMDRYFLAELDRLAGEGYHPAARSAVIDCCRNWAVLVDGIELESHLEVIQWLRDRLEANQKVCVECGQTYFPYPFRFKRQKFCSTSCRFQFNHRKWNARQQAKREARVCLQCGASMGHRNMKSMFCSRICRERNYRARRKGKK